MHVDYVSKEDIKSVEIDELLSESNNKLQELRNTSKFSVDHIKTIIKELDKISQEIKEERTKISMMMEKLSKMDIEFANLKYGNESVENILKQIIDK